MEHARHAMTNMFSLLMARHVVLALMQPSIYLPAKLKIANVLLVLPTVPKPILLEHARPALTTIFSLLMSRHVVLALSQPSICLLAKLLMINVLMVLLTVKHSMLMEHARLAPPTMFFLMMPRHVVLALIVPSIYLLVKPKIVTVLLVPLIARHAVWLEFVAHALMATIWMLPLRHAKLVIPDVPNVLVLELTSVLHALPSTLPIPVASSAKLVTLDVTHVLVTELTSVLNALHTTMSILLVRSAQLALLENTCQLVKL